MTKRGYLYDPKAVGPFGLPARVVTEDEFAKELANYPGGSIHYVMRVADTGDHPWFPPDVVERRRMVTCEECREVCWIDDQSRIDPKARVMCSHCCPVKVDVLFKRSPNYRPGMHN